MLTDRPHSVEASIRRSLTVIHDPSSPYLCSGVRVGAWPYRRGFDLRTESSHLRVTSEQHVCMSSRGQSASDWRR